jgi:hypothetical protein
VTALDLSTALGETSRARLAMLADVLIPGGAGLAAASAADVAGQWINRVLAAHADLAEVVSLVVALPGEPATVLSDLRRDQPEVFDTFAFAVAAAYYMNPAVRNDLGYPGIAPRPVPVAEGETEYYLEDDILGPVVQRGSIYRRTGAR